MAEMTERERLARAANLWTGRGKETFPGRDAAAVVSAYGLEEGSRLVAMLESLEADFYASDAWKRAKSVEEMEMLVADDFRKAHPEAPEEVVGALTWCYIYDYK